LTGLVQLTLSESDALFSEHSDGDRLKFSGAQNIIVQPEFQEPAELRRLIEFMENRPAVIDLIEDADSTSGEDESVGEAQVLIGSEISDRDETAVYSLITARYKLGDTVGTVGVLGPKRMDYSHVVSLVEGMAALLSQPSSDAVH
jgi:heat-inducible transcriptional repressor